MTRSQDRVDVSVVMPTFNRAHWLGEAIASVAGQDFGGLSAEVVVCDNNSADETAAVAARAAADAPIPVRYVRETARGDAQARNRAVAESRGRWLAFFDDDQFAGRRWALELVRCAEAHGASVVGGPVLLAIDEERRRRLGRVCREQLREIDLSGDVVEYAGKQLPGTGNALVSRELFDRLGGFSLAFPSGGSDSDFFLRAREAGERLLYTPKAPIRHRVDERRLTPAYLRWGALVSGSDHIARFDLEDHGRLGLAARCLARLGQAAAVNGPLWLWAGVRGDEGERLGRMALLSRCEGYARRTLNVLAPRLFPQEAFFASLDMSKGREIGGTVGPPAARAEPPPRKDADAARPAELATKA